MKIFLLSILLLSFFLPSCELDPTDYYDKDYRYEITGSSSSVKILYKDENGDFVYLETALPFSVDLEEMPDMFLQAINNEANLMRATVYIIKHSGVYEKERQYSYLFIDIQ